MHPMIEADALLRGHAQDMCDQVEDAVDGTRVRVASHVQEHPLRSLVIAVGAGLLLGMVLGLGHRLKHRD